MLCVWPCRGVLICVRATGKRNSKLHGFRSRYVLALSTQAELAGWRTTLEELSQRQSLAPAALAEHGREVEGAGLLS